MPSDRVINASAARVFSRSELPSAWQGSAVESLAARFQNPVEKLRFLQRALERYEGFPAVARSRFLRPFAIRWAAYDALADISDSQEAPLAYRFRYPLTAFTLLAATFSLGFVGFHGFRAGANKVFEIRHALVPRTSIELPPVQKAGSPEPIGRGGGAPNEAPATPRLAPTPKSIWLVEKHRDGELWSNGLRILTRFETRTQPRRYVLFPKDGSAPFASDGRPIGIVFHTTENDMAPFEADFNGSILRTTESLLRWLAKRGLYNYLIDRFGRVYRLVPDSNVATHAGFSVWADGNYIYLNLNESFIGVSFESQWSPQAGQIEVLTPPQLQAGLNLTDMLRAHYSIEDVNTTTHGLVSVNPEKMLIGHHRDWARGFPFADLRLTDKYLVPVPSVLELGFRYDEHFVAEMKGELWPGLEKASAEFERRARARGIAPEALQWELRQTYRERLELLAGSQELARAAARD